MGALGDSMLLDGVEPVNCPKKTYWKKDVAVSVHVLEGL